MMDLSILWDVADWTRSGHLLTHLHISNSVKTQVFLFPLPHLWYISSWNKSALNSLPSHNIGSMPFSLKGLTPIYIFIYHLCIISALLPCSYQKHYIGLAQIFPYFTLELQLALVSGFILASLCLYWYLELQWGNLGQKDSDRVWGPPSILDMFSVGSFLPVNFTNISEVCSIGTSFFPVWVYINLCNPVQTVTLSWINRDR